MDLLIYQPVVSSVQEIELFYMIWNDEMVKKFQPSLAEPRMLCENNVSICICIITNSPYSKRKQQQTPNLNCVWSKFHLLIAPFVVFIFLQNIQYLAGKM